MQKSTPPKSKRQLCLPNGKKVIFRSGTPSQAVDQWSAIFTSSSPFCWKKFKDIPIELFAFIEEYPFAEFDAIMNLSPAILPTINLVSSFPNLLLLNLSYNSTETLEGLSWLNAPNLQNLFLIDNKVCNLKPFSKCQFKKLKFLSLESCPVPRLNDGILVRSQLLSLKKIFCKKNLFVKHSDTFDGRYFNGNLLVKMQCNGINTASSLQIVFQ